MKVTVSVFGRFHAFYLAHQLYKRKHLERLITSYPKFEVEKYGIPSTKTKSLLLYELIDRFWNRKLPASFKSNIDFIRWFNSAYGQAASKCIPKQTDVYVGLSGKSLSGLQEAKKNGAVTIVERCSSHPKVHWNLLLEEYEQHGVYSKSKFIKSQIELFDEVGYKEYEICDFISVPSEFAKRTFMENGFSEDRLLVASWGVDLEQFRQTPKDDETFRVVFAGGMSLRKGVHYLLQAFAELQLSNAELWLLGSITEEIKPFFQKYEGHFRHFGHVPQAQLHQYYSQCSVFAICSLEDGFGMVVPQAMSCGLPVLCTKNTGAADLIIENKEGFVIPIRSVEAIKEKISWYYNNQKKCKQMGLNAKKKVDKGFTWNDYGDRISKLYEECLSKKKS